jgi:hypothetical protein
MPNTGSVRFWFNNLAETAVLKNGTGGGAPADDEVAGWPMENALAKDRTFIWQQSSGAGTIEYDFDLTGAGSNVTVGLLASLGHYGTPSTAIGIASILTRYSTNANGYPPVAASSWTSFTGGGLTLGLGVRDAAAVIAVPVACRYIRYEITATTAFALGRVFVGGVADLDWGFISSPGRLRELVKPILANEVGANPTKTRVGDNHYVLHIPINEDTISVIQNLRIVALKDQPFLMIDFDGTVTEAVVDDDRMRETLLFDVSELYDADIRIRTLG